jgi:hypothetical protein
MNLDKYWILYEFWKFETDLIETGKDKGFKSDSAQRA